MMNYFQESVYIDGLSGSTHF